MNKKLIAGAAALIIAFSAVQIQPVLSGDAGTHSIQITAEASKKSNSKKTNKSSSLASKAVKAKEKDLVYKYDAVKEGAIITGYKGSADCIILPSKVGGDKVVGVDMYVCLKFKYIKVPEGVKSVRFDDCRALQEIDLPESLTTLEHGAFLNCHSLKKISLPKKITIIPRQCFYSCESLSEIEMPSVRYVHESAFEYCKALKKISLKNFKCIGKDAFDNCEGISQLTIPYIKDTFDEDGYYRGETDEDGNPTQSIAGGAFAFCNNLKKVTTYSNISPSEFYWCESLEKVVIITDKNFKEDRFIIHNSGFDRCYALTSVDLSKCTKPVTIGKHAFSECTSLRTIKIPKGTVIGYEAFDRCSSLRTIDLPSDVKVAEHAFDGCNALTVTYKGKKYNYSNFDELYALFN